MGWYVSTMILASMVSLLADGGSDDTAMAGIVVPAIIAGCVALLSTAVTIVTLVLKGRDDAAGRRHVIATSLLSRRVDALEFAWVEVFLYEQRGEPSGDAADLVKASVWMSQKLQSSYVRLLASEAPHASEFSKVRELIQAELKGLTT